jgi:eukaryotic-like serine/threonine-protein kinase
MPEDYFGIVGTTFGAYRIEAVVAEGGFGVVYRGYHEAFQASVAIKCLKMQQMSSRHQAEFLAKFQEEAAVLFRLSASLPSVVRPLHVDKMTTPDGRFVPFMAMEWLEGQGLDRIIEDRTLDGLAPLPMATVVALLAPVGRAVARAHNFPGPSGPVCIVHRDIKPDNIFLCTVNDEDVVKLFDFGIAKVQSVATQIAGKISQSGALMPFTPGYAAPEQWMPKRYGQTGPWTDVWGLALTVLETAVGRPIIDGDSAEMMELACDPQRRPSPRNEGLLVSDAVEAVFERALAVDPRDRFPDARQLWDALEATLGLELSQMPNVGGPNSRGSGALALDLPHLLEARRAAARLDDYEEPLEALGSQGRGGSPPSSDPYHPSAVRGGHGGYGHLVPSPEVPDLGFDGFDGAVGGELEALGPGSVPPESIPPQTHQSPVYPHDGGDAGSLDLALELASPPSARSSGALGQSSSSMQRPPAAMFDTAISPRGPDSRPAPSSGSGGAALARPPVSTSGPRPQLAPSLAAKAEATAQQGSLVDRIKLPLVLAGLGAVVIAGDAIAGAALGAPVLLGAIRLSWIGAGLAVVGVLWIVYGLIFPPDD